MNAHEQVVNSNFDFFTFVNYNAKKEDIMEGDRLTNEEDRVPDKTNAIYLPTKILLPPHQRSLPNRQRMVSSTPPSFSMPTRKRR